jgi:serine phosphatase RsbU (regulator of sigma subunit)
MSVEKWPITKGFSLSVFSFCSRGLATFLSFALLMANPYVGHSQSSNESVALEQLVAEAILQKNNKSAFNYSLELAKLKVADKKYRESIAHFTQATKYAKLLKDPAAQFTSYDGIGSVYMVQKNYSKAIASFKACVEIAQDAHDMPLEAIAQINRAKAEEGATKYKRTIGPLERALELAIKLKDEKLQMDCYLKLAENHLKIGNTEQYNVHQNLYQQIAGSHESIDMSNRKLAQIKNQMSQVQSEKKNAEAVLQQTEDTLRNVEALNRERQLQIDLLHKDHEISEIKIREQDAQLENEQLWLMSIIGGSLLAGILIAVLIVGYRKKLKTNEKIHKQSENIQGSINYAKRIQEAMLSQKNVIDPFVADSFILFKPRDTVSGDFYWFSEIHNGAAATDLAFAAVDCTGHGVPGAFMSMIGMNSLNGMVSRGITKTDAMLATLHTEIRTSLRQEETGNNDGMDVALCIFRQEKRTIEFSGAKNPLVYIQNNELIQIKGDIQPIGGSKSKPTIAFKQHEIAIDKPTTVYLYSDGYRDQFGGQDNTKFMSKKFTKLLLEIHQLPMDQQKEWLDKAIEEWKGENGQTDDILVMGIRLNAEDKSVNQVPVEEPAKVEVVEMV